MPVILTRNERLIRRADARADYIERFIAEHQITRTEAAKRLNMTRAEVNGVLNRAAQRRAGRAA